MAKKFDPRSRTYIEMPDQPVYIQRGYATLQARIAALEARPSGGSSSFSIPQLTSDPVSPSPGDAWVLKTTTGGSGGGRLKWIFGLGVPVTSTGAPSTTYKFCYRTAENTTIRVTMT